MRAVAEVHLRHRAPASFFIVARLVEAAGPRLREILDHDLFDLQSHSFTHANMLAIRDDPASVRRELVDSKRLIEDLFGREVIGFTAPGGSARGFLGEPKLLEALWDAGYRYVRTLSWQPGNLAPAPLTQPFWFADDGFPELLEISAHAWHDNILTGQPSAAAWPRPCPGATRRGHPPPPARSTRPTPPASNTPATRGCSPTPPASIPGRSTGSTAAPGRSTCCWIARTAPA